MPAISMSVRTQIANQLNTGRMVAAIATDLGLSQQSVYRLKKKFQQGDGTFVAAPASVATKQAFSRAQLVEISQWLEAEPKLTLAELRQKAVAEGWYTSLDKVPDASTLWRQLNKLGFKWRKTKYSDPRAKRSVIQFERCAFRMAQDNGLDPTTLLSIDESNFHIWDQPGRAWGTTAKPATLEKPKGKTLRNAVFATIGFSIVNGQAKALIHWVFIHPRKTWRPLPDTIQAYEIKPQEKQEIRDNLSKQIINSLSNRGLSAELKKLGIRAPANTQASMKDTLLRVRKRATREGELRLRSRGRPDAGGQCIPPTGDARMVSEYLHECLVPFLKGEGLKNEEGTECELTADEGIQHCPDGGKREFRPELGNLSILWDSAPSHLPTTHKRVSPFHKYAQDKLGLKGTIATPPYSAWYNPVELFFSYTKRYIRKYAPATVPELIERLREATEKVTGDMIKGWFKKSGYLIPGEPLQERPADPNAGQARCTLPENAQFERKEAVACYDQEGKLRREKKKGRKRWNRYDEMDDEEAESLENISVVKRKAVRPRKRKKITACAPPEEGKTRWTGLGEEPEGLEQEDYSSLWADHEDNEAVEAILDERERRGNTEYLVKWIGFDSSHNDWVPSSRFTAGLNTLIRNWRSRNRRRAERQQLRANAARVNRPRASYKPKRKPKKSDVIAVYPGKTVKSLFWVAKVIDVLADGRLRIHWWNARKLDGTFTPEYKQPKGGKHIKGTAGPYLGTIDRSAVIDVLSSLRGRNKGSIDRDQLTEIIKLAKQYKEK